MEYRQCPAKIFLPGYGKSQCVMFAGHKTIGGVEHNYGWLGPYTPGMDPASYIRAGRTMVPWWRRLLWTLTRRRNNIEGNQS